MANPTYITDPDQVLDIVRREIAAYGRASDVEFDFDGDHYNGKIFEVIERDGEIELFGKRYSGSEFTVLVSEITELTIFA